MNRLNQKPLMSTFLEKLDNGGLCICEGSDIN